LYNFSEGLAAVELDNKYGYIDTSGSIVCQPKFENASSFSEGLAAVEIDSKWGYIDKNGTVIITPVWDYAGKFKNGIAVVKEGDKYSFISTKGDFAFLPLYISDEMKAIGTLGLMIGDGNGLTPEYSTKTSTRLQAAIMVLRIKNLESKASAFTGTSNFNDANLQTWTIGRNIMGYLKTNKNVGFIGDENGNFNPNDILTEKQYTKVMLEMLGYKTNVDFTWDNVEEFAKGIGIEPSNSTKFTNNDLAKATFKFLNTKTKSGERLIEQLIRTGEVKKDNAVISGLVK